MDDGGTPRWNRKPLTGPIALAKRRKSQCTCLYCEILPRVVPTFDERLDLLMEGKQRLAEDFLRPLPQKEETGGELFSDRTAEAARQS